MDNIMQNALDTGEAIDLSGYPKNEDGDAILPPSLDIDGKDLCFADTRTWVFSVGRNLKTGQVLASTDGKFYLNPDYECLWLR